LEVRRPTHSDGGLHNSPWQESKTRSGRFLAVLTALAQALMEGSDAIGVGFSRSAGEEGGGITTEMCYQTFRGTGITAYLENGGTLEKARQMAAHASTRTTQLYDRREDRVTLDEVVKINIRRVRINRQGVEGESPLR